MRTLERLTREGYDALRARIAAKSSMSAIIRYLTEDEGAYVTWVIENGTLSYMIEDGHEEESLPEIASFADVCGAEPILRIWLTALGFIDDKRDYSVTLKAIWDSVTHIIGVASITVLTFIGAADVLTHVWSLIWRP